MKNTVIVEFDSNNEQPIKIGKSDEFKQPNTPEEVKEMIKLDMFTLCSAISTLIHVAHQNQYLDSVEALKECINNLEANLNSKK